MTIELKIPPEWENKIQNYAQLTGMDVDRFVLSLVRAGLQFTDTMETAAAEDVTPELSHEEWSARFHDLVANAPPVRGKGEVDVSRESIYEDRV